MLRGLTGRVGRLENGRPDPCKECGWDGDWSNVKIVVEWVDADSPAEPDEYCGTCRRQLTCTVHTDWGDSAYLTERR